MITSLQNQQIKEVVKLREGKCRREVGLFLIDGRREIERAIQSGIRVDKVFYMPDRCPESLLTALRQSGGELIDVSAPVMAKVSFGNRDEGVVAVAFRPQGDLDNLKLSDNPLIAVAEGVEKPGNIGALLRSVDGAGLDARIVADCKTDVFDPNSVRASLGTIFSVPVVETSSEEAYNWLKKKNFRIFAARCDSSIPYTTADFTIPCAIAVGAEADGLTNVWSGPEVQAIHLPMNGIADSLNVSVAAAVCYYEAIRQRIVKPTAKQ